MMFRLTKAALVVVPVTLLAACASTGKAGKQNAEPLPTISANCVQSVPLAVGETDAKVVELSEAICADGQNIAAWQALSQRLFEIEHYDKAVQAANQTLKVQPNNAVAKDILFRSGLKITSNGLSQIKDSSRLLNGSNLKDANQLVHQINQNVGEGEGAVMAGGSGKTYGKSNNSYSSRKKPVRQQPVVKSTPVVKKPAPKPAPVVTKPTAPAPKPAATQPAATTSSTHSAAPRNPFSGFN